MILNLCTWKLHLSPFLLALSLSLPRSLSLSLALSLSRSLSVSLSFVFSLSLSLSLPLFSWQVRLQKTNKCANKALVCMNYSLLRKPEHLFTFADPNYQHQTRTRHQRPPYITKCFFLQGTGYAQGGLLGEGVNTCFATRQLIFSYVEQRKHVTWTRETCGKLGFREFHEMTTCVVVKYHCDQSVALRLFLIDLTCLPLWCLCTSV